MLHQEANPYVPDDRMFIKIMIDFGGMPKTLLSYILSINSGWSMDILQYSGLNNTTELTTQQKIQPEGEAPFSQHMHKYR
ncbi:unnamed protein product [Rotaria socialis]|uniref:Uncharacterized protein n=1 Tax=Rotaria socialis TaxID=392032 RepID=A0A821XHN7_9BILA|nr:unnamed protein product [Rotaria socialis]CAF4943007.1 unnamed protein product [Rotaria socialis]